MATFSRTMRLAVFLFLLAASPGANAVAAAPEPQCPDNGTTLSKDCFKEIRVWNNTPGAIWVVLQGTRQDTNAFKCPKTGTLDSGGNVWLQAAFADYTKCYLVKNDYHVYVNPKSGIPRGRYVSLVVPWWSKRSPDAPDLYIDWWRGGRILIFDDKNALDDSYSKLKSSDLVKFAAKSPVVACTKLQNNSCLPSEVEIYQVPDTPERSAEIAKYTPYQLNEFTFADVSPLSSSLDSGGDFVDFNQGYNVSNVDQVYLPIAIEPVRDPPDIGYIGTISSAKDVRDTLAAFTKVDIHLQNPQNWPIYNNPSVNNQPRYPNAGIRVPSAFEVFNFYMKPTNFPDGKTPEIVPAVPPTLIQNMIDQWKACTTGTKGCPQSGIYKDINDVFQANYHKYITSTNCTPPDYLQTLSDFALLRFVYGWVPFNVACTGNLADFDLPTVAKGNRTALDYI